MTHRNFHHHFVPHTHDDGTNHRAHAISLVALFLYLQVLVVSTFGFYLIAKVVPNILGSVSFSASEIIDLTNQKRQEKGLSQLMVNSQLSQAAGEKAGDMFAHDYWAHYSPNGRTPWDFITNSGYRYVFAGENLARDFDNPKSVVDAWMRSSTHRSNLLDKNFKEIGVAVAFGKLNGREGVLVVQMFGAKSDLLAANDVPLEIGGRREFSEATVLGSRGFLLAKGMTLTLLGFVFLLFGVEVAVVSRRANIYLQGAVLAHLMFLGFILLAVWYSVSGAVL